MSPILLLFRYFGLFFSCLEFVFWHDLALEDFCKFSMCNKFSVPKGANGEAGARFFSALMKYVSAWVSESAEEIPGIVVF